MVQPSPYEVVPQTGRKAAAGGSPYLGHPNEVAAAGGPSRPHRHAVAPAAPARAAKPPRSRSAYGVATVISAVGEGVRCMARPPPGAARRRRGPAGARFMGITAMRAARRAGGDPQRARGRRWARDAVSEGGGGAKWQGGDNFGAHTPIGAEPRVARCLA